MGLVFSSAFVIKQSSDALRVVGESFEGTSQVLSLIVIMLLVRYIYRTATKDSN